MDITIRVIVGPQVRKAGLDRIVRSMEAIAEKLTEADHSPGIAILIACEQICKKRCDRREAEKVAPTCGDRESLAKNNPDSRVNGGKKFSISIGYLLPEYPERRLLEAREDELVCIVRPVRHVPEEELLHAIFGMIASRTPYLVEIYRRSSGKREKIRSDNQELARIRAHALRNRFNKPRVSIARHLPKK